MKFGKQGYFLAKENELKINKLLSEQISGFGGELFCLNEVVSLSDGFRYTFPNFALSGGGSVFVSASFSFSSENKIQTQVDLLVNDKYVASGAIDVDGLVQFALEAKVQTQKGEANTLCVEFKNANGVEMQGVSVSLLGAGVKFLDYSSDIFFDGAFCEDRLVMFYIKNKRAYFVEKKPNLTSLNISEFAFKTQAKSCALAFSKQTNLNGKHKLFLFRVDDLGNLYVSEFLDNLNETFVANGVSFVSCTTVASEFVEDILVCVIQNGLPKYFFVSFEDEVMHFSAPKQIFVKNENVKKIWAVCTQSNNQFIVVQTSKNNYVFVNSKEIFQSSCISHIVPKVSVNFSSNLVQNV